MAYSTWYTYNIKRKIIHIFRIDPDKNNDINKLYLMEINYYIYNAICSKSNMNLTMLERRLKILYQTCKYSSNSTGKYENIQTNITKTYLIKRQTKIII